MNKKLIASAIAGLGLMASGSASAIVVGGVDFGNPGTTHLETTTLAETFISGNNQQLQGYGQVNTVNGNLLYAGANRLYFVFDQYMSANYSPTSVDFTLGQVRVYLLPTFNLLSQASYNPDAPINSNLEIIQAGSLWAVMNGHSFNGTPNTLASAGIFTGATVNFTGAGLLDVVGGGLADVQAYLDSSSFSDGVGGFADVNIGTSGTNGGPAGAGLNRFDNTAGCGTGLAQAGQWCIAGSADLRGPTVVPEPGVLALVGLGLLGMGVSLRKRKAA